MVETSRLFEGSLPPVLSNSRPKRQGKILENLCWPISMDPYCVWSLRASTTSPARSELNDSKVAKKLTYWMNNLIVIVSQEKQVIYVVLVHKLTNIIFISWKPLRRGHTKLRDFLFFCCWLGSHRFPNHIDSSSSHRFI